MITVPGNQSRTKSTHDTCNIRSDCFTAGNTFKAAQDGIIIESSTLYDNVFSKGRSIGYFNYFIQCIFNNRVSQTGRNICYRSPFFLSLLDFGIHEYGTSGSKINWMLGKQSFFCKIADTVIQRFGEGLNERTTAGGTSLVQLYTVYGLILNLDTLHILTTDVQNTVYFRIKECSSRIMRYSLYFTFIQHQGCLDQGFSISGRTGTDYLCLFRHQGVDLLDSLDCCL